MDSKQTVLALYSAYATGDAEKIRNLLHDEVVWTAASGQCHAGGARARYC